jgi:hypothetical protein
MAGTIFDQGVAFLVHGVLIIRKGANVMPEPKIEILTSETHLERLFLDTVRIGLDSLHSDPDYPATAQEIISQFDKFSDWRFSMETIKSLIEQEGLSSGEPALTMQAEALMTAFRDAGFADFKFPMPKLLKRGRKLILANF